MHCLIMVPLGAIVAQRSGKERRGRVAGWLDDWMVWVGEKIEKVNRRNTEERRQIEVEK